jgi:adenine-specific DNA-methyltransferase
MLERKYSFDQSGVHEEDNHSENMIIHGDNLEALKALLPQYEGKIKCIYIDPPYNTGNEGWVYNDNVNDPKIKKWLGEVVGKEGEDLSRHDKWLCMMYPRLCLLQKLLSEDGAIFISIDDNELANLRLVCDEIFGSKNFVTIITWFKKASPSNDAKFFSNDTEFILVYSKNKDKWKLNRLPLNEKQLKNYSNPDNDSRGAYNSSTYTCAKTKQERPNLFYPIVNPNNGREVYPKETAVWKYSKEQTEIYQKENRLFWGINGDAQFPRYKKFLSENKGVVNRTLWHYEDVNHTQGATNEIKEINIGDFNTPKPTKLIDRILKIATNKNDIILDSFAGSGTTAHAVLNMNKSDGGSRKFILVEMGDYANNITAERVKRVINGYGEGKNVVNGTGGDFSYYELGETLFLPDGTLNNNAEIMNIKKYIWYTETNGVEYIENKDEEYYLGSHNDTAYYFFFEKDMVTILDYKFLMGVRVKQQAYIIYADSCAISECDLQRWNITFKKIPRDIEHI